MLNAVEDVDERDERIRLLDSDLGSLEIATSAMRPAANSGDIVSVRRAHVYKVA
ncbi:MAG: hypothetical protein WAX69_00995 [Victivallales bacterium]